MEADSAPAQLMRLPQKWSVLANSIERTRVKMLDAQKEAFKVLREQVRKMDSADYTRPIH